MLRVIEIAEIDHDSATFKHVKVVLGVIHNSLCDRLTRQYRRQPFVDDHSNNRILTGILPLGLILINQGSFCTFVLMSMASKLYGIPSSSKVMEAFQPFGVPLKARQDEVR
jgi:hypothetical protein